MILTMVSKAATPLMQTNLTREHNRFVMELDVDGAVFGAAECLGLDVGAHVDDVGCLWVLEPFVVHRVLEEAAPDVCLVFDLEEEHGDVL